MTGQTPLLKVNVGWRLAKFYGYALFADGQEFDGDGSDALIDLATAYNAGENDLVSISVYGPDDTEADWLFTDFDTGAPIGTMSCASVEEARALLRECFPE